MVCRAYRDMGIRALRLGITLLAGHRYGLKGYPAGWLGIRNAGYII